MKYVVVSQAYTIVMFGIAIYLWKFWPGAIESAPTGVPVYWVDALSAIELFCMASTGIVWVITGLISLHNMRRRDIWDIAENVAKNFLVVSLAFVTIVVAVSGSMVFSRTIQPLRDYARTMQPLPDYAIHAMSQVSSGPLSLATLYFFGTPFCEAGWIIQGLFRFRPFVKSIFKRLVKRS